MEHNHTPEEERRIRDAALDHTIEETFPASDPPSTLPDPDNDDLLHAHSITPPPGDVRNRDERVLVQDVRVRGSGVQRPTNVGL